MVSAPCFSAREDVLPLLVEAHAMSKRREKEAKDCSGRFHGSEAEKELSPGLELPSIPSPHQTNTSPQVDESVGSFSKRLLKVSSPTRGDRRVLGLVDLSKGEGPSKDEVLAASLKKRTERPGETLAERNVKRAKQDQQQRTSRGNRLGGGVEVGLSKVRRIEK